VILRDIIHQLAVMKYWYRYILRPRKNGPNIGKSRRLCIAIGLHSLLVKWKSL